MEFKGTKLSWEITEPKNGNGFLYIGKDGKIATCYSVSEFTGSITEETRANAKLISKAPEMIEQLKECLEFLQKVQSPATQALFLRQSIKNLIKEATTI